MKRKVHRKKRNKLKSHEQEVKHTQTAKKTTDPSLALRIQETEILKSKILQSDEQAVESELKSKEKELEKAKLELLQKVCLHIGFEIEKLDEKQIPSVKLIKEEFLKTSVDVIKIADLCCQIINESSSEKNFLNIEKFFFKKASDIYITNNEFLKYLFLHTISTASFWKVGNLTETQQKILTTYNFLQLHSEKFISLTNNDNFNQYLIQIYFYDVDCHLFEFYCADLADKSISKFVADKFMAIRSCIENLSNNTAKKNWQDILEKDQAVAQSRLNYKKQINLKKEKEAKRTEDTLHQLETMRAKLEEKSKSEISRKKEITNLTSLNQKLKESKQQKDEEVKDLEVNNNQQRIELEKLKKDYHDSLREKDQTITNLELENQALTSKIKQLELNLSASLGKEAKIQKEISEQKKIKAAESPKHPDLVKIKKSTGPNHTLQPSAEIELYKSEIVLQELKERRSQKLSDEHLIEDLIYQINFLKLQVSQLRAFKQGTPLVLSTTMPVFSYSMPTLYPDTFSYHPLSTTTSIFSPANAQTISPQVRALLDSSTEITYSFT